MSNHISHSYRDDTAFTYEHDKANRMTLIDGLSQDYDLAGNVTLAYSADRGDTFKYEYDHLNQLTAVYDKTGTDRSAAFAYDALGRRIEFTNDHLDTTTRYYYDGPNEVLEYDAAASSRAAYYVHGTSYVDERLMMYNERDPDYKRPYYYTLDRQYDVRGIVDRAGAFRERYAYDAYGRPRIRESCGRGDMDNDTELHSGDYSRFLAVLAGTYWDARADMNDDGSFTSADSDLWLDKYPDWPGPPEGGPVVAQAFSDFDTPYMFQGVPHFPLATDDDATSGVLLLNHHRARFNDPVTGRWITRDPIGYWDSMNLYEYLLSHPIYWLDPFGWAKVVIIVGEDPVIGQDLLVGELVKEGTKTGDDVSVKYVDKKKQVKSVVEDDSVSEIIYIGHGGAATDPPWLVIDPEDPYSEGEVTPKDVAGWEKGKKLIKVHLRTCNQGTKENKEEWQKAFGEDVEVAAPVGEYRPHQEGVWRLLFVW